MTDKKPSNTTPFMAQYLRIKSDHPDALLFFRMGDFYELFFEDAIKAAEALDITLTQRGQHNGDPIPMAGVPHHSADPYLARLIRLGFRVAVCEQTESPADAKKRGYKAVVNREVVRIVTPGTLTEETLLDARSENYLCAVFAQKDDVALAMADISTGQFRVLSVNNAELSSTLASYSIGEIVYLSGVEDQDQIIKDIHLTGPTLTPHTTRQTGNQAGLEALRKLFGLKASEGLGHFTDVELSAVSLLISYIELTQAGAPPKLDHPKRDTAERFMVVDETTRHALEIEHTQTGDRKGSLLHTIDRTVTAGGARSLYERLSRPLLSAQGINGRLDAIQIFLERDETRHDLRSILKSSPDIERARSRLRLGRSNPKDLAAVTAGISAAKAVQPFLQDADIRRSDIISGINSAINLSLENGLDDLLEFLREMLVDEPPVQMHEGGFIREGASKQLDQLRTLRDDSRKIIAELEAEYQALTDIQQLKIKFNNMLGYYVEIPSRMVDALENGDHARDFHRRQGLANATRYTTDKLADIARQIETATSDAKQLELALYQDMVERTLSQSDQLLTLATHLAELDIACAGAHWADETSACRPELFEDRRFIIENGRHPVVEAALKKQGQGFVSNSLKLGDESGKDAYLKVITGPNMAGKSTFLRQAALLTILAQSGWYVPAKSMQLGLVDRVFSRVGASDDLARGKSTFMVEMLETASILNQASEKALVILDEVGRGTSTYDGLAIAWSCVEYLHDTIRCRGLFATHYHELTQLAARLPFADNLSLKAREWKNDLIFLHEVQDGPADESYGVQVAKLAGLPKAAVTRAKQVLQELETAKSGTGVTDDMPLFSFAEQPDDTLQVSDKPAANEPHPLEVALSKADIDDLSPRDALNLLYELKEVIAKKA